MSPRTSCIIHPSYSRQSGAEANAWAQETPAPRDSAAQEACHACSEWMWLQRLKSWVKGDLELMCSWAACMGKPSPMARHWPTGVSYICCRLVFFRQNRGRNLVCLWFLLSFLVSCRACFKEARMRQCHRWGHPRRRRGKVLLYWCLLGGMPRVSSARWPSSKVNLWRLVGLGMWIEREFATCRAHRLRVHDG
jgi:hypothetical protein